MNNLRVLVNDDVLAKLQAISDQTRRELEAEAGHRLATAVSLLPVAGRVVVVSGDTLETLERILGGGSLMNATDLERKVARLAGISFQHVRLPFTPNQLEALKDKADRQGLSVQQLVERTAPRMYEQFFDLVERSR